MRWRSTVLIALALFTAAGQNPAPQLSAPQIIAVPVDGMVHPITVEIIGHAIEQAQAQHATLLLIRLNTPGGLLEATRQIIQQLSASPIPVITYVTPSGARAASAGFFLLQAGDVAAMSPGTNTGAASPVLIGQQMDPVMREKVENDAAALLRSMTSRRGRNTQLAEDAVRKAKAFTEKEALDQKLIDLIASDEQQLLKSLDGREITRWDGSKQVLHVTGATVTEVRRTLRERLDWIDCRSEYRLHSIGAGGTRNLRRIFFAGIDFPGRGGRHSGIAGALGADYPADQLGGCRAAGAGGDAVCFGGKVRLAWDFGDRRDGRNGAGCNAVDQRPA